MSESVPSPLPLLPVILSGGSGTRLWPLSRENYPKQFLAFGSSLSMLQETALRLRGLETRLPMVPLPILVCNEAHRFIVAQQLQEIGIAGASILLESVGRNTAPALTLAALQRCQEGADAVLLVMPADHLIADRDAFLAAVETGFSVAAEGAMVTFGIVPDRPETGYGYIQRAPELTADGSAAVAAFVEKPSLEVAQRYVDAGDYLWNSGLFLVRAQVWLDALAQCRPDILAACKAALAAAQRDADFVRPEPALFAECPADSIDYAVMERLPRHPEFGVSARVVPLQAGWSDLGAWDALWAAMERDDANNVVFGDAILEASENTLVHATGRLVAGIGLRDLVVVETADAVLVAHQNQTQAVKDIVARLRLGGRSLAHSHRKIHRPWGWYDSIDSGDRFQVKRIVVNPGATLSLQMHHHRAEHWIVVRGTAEVTHGDQVFLLSENQSTFIPLGHTHRLANPGKVPLEIIEVQSGTYLGEDDIVRFADTYGRAQANPVPG